MSIQATPVPTFMIPENAPFSPEQRAWLSGFLIAAIAPHASGITPLSAGEAAGLIPETTASAGVVLARNDDAPWHDPATPAQDRMKLAEGRPLAPRLMAAMAQQDCGQCGYSCADYANAIFLKTDERLNLCVPGGKETNRLLRALAEELNQVPPSVRKNQAAPPDAAPAPPVLAAAPRYSRENPVEAVFLSRRRLNGEGSEKHTWHIEFDIADSGVKYSVGDSFGIYPQNDLGLVDQIIAMLGAPHNIIVRRRTLRESLRNEVALGSAPDALFELFSYISGGKTLAKGTSPCPRRGPGWRRQKSRRARRAAQVRRGAATPRSIR